VTVDQEKMPTKKKVIVTGKWLKCLKMCNVIFILFFLLFMSHCGYTGQADTVIHPVNLHHVSLIFKVTAHFNVCTVFINCLLFGNYIVLLVE
jgi:hypothetical protein